jgi:hypothetical protein
LQNCPECGYKKWLKTDKKTADDIRIWKCGNVLCEHEQEGDRPFERPKPKILYIDVETSLSELYGNFGLKVRGEHISSKLVKHPFFIICWSAMWMDEKKIYSGCVSLEDALLWQDRYILPPLVELMNRADIVAGHGVDPFDAKVINTRILLNGSEKPEDYKTWDTLKLARKKFRFESNELDYLCRIFGLRPKMPMCIEDWIAITQGDKDTLNKMQEYNKGDVKEGAQVLEKLKGWDNKRWDFGLRAFPKIP